MREGAAAVTLAPELAILALGVALALYFTLILRSSL